MATGTYAPFVPQQYFDNNGAPLASGTITTQIAGTSTPIATYSDVALTVANANPIPLNAAGRPTSGAIFLSPGSSYKFLIKDSTGSTLATYDNISSVPGSSSNADITGVAGEALTAGQAVYLSDGSGGKVAGTWYKADAANPYSSTSPEVGMVPANIASAGSGTIRLGGAVTGLTSLTIGTTYYIGTAGAMTSTVPSNARKLGVADTTSSLVLWIVPPVAVVDNTIVDGRLTLTTAVPVTVADVTGAVSVFFAPYKGNRIALFDGTNWIIRTFTEITQALGTLTTDLPYDVFAYDNAGTVATEILAWTSKTARATALVLQDGVLSKTGALTRRYLGSFLTTATTTTEDSFAKRHLWNYYNRVARAMRVKDTTDSWTQGDATIRQAGGVATNQVEFVIGWPEVLVEGVVIGSASTNGANSVFMVGIGEDSTTAFETNGLVGPQSGFNAGTPMITMGQLRKYPAVGWHRWTWLEKGQIGVTTTWYGDNGANGTQSGLSGQLLG